MSTDFLKAAFLAVFVFVVGQGTTVMAQDRAPYEMLWAQVDSLDDRGLARSAREKASEVLALARGRSEEDQVVKALLYQARYTAQLEEDEINRVVEDLRTEVDLLRPVASAILHSILGEVYWQYYQSRRWVIMDRGTVPGSTEDDLETWDARRLVSEAIAQLEHSLEDRQLLAAESIGSYKVLLQGPEDDRHLRPTVYDFLAHRAIDILGSGESGLLKPLETFDFSSPGFLAPAREFAALGITSPDSLSPEFIVISTYQELIRLHLDDSNPDVLVTVDLERLKYVKDQSTIPDRESLYVERLRRLEGEYLDRETGTDVSFSLASALAEIGRSYRPFGDDEARWKLKEAYDICTAAVDRFPDAVGAANCRALAASIESKQVTVQVDKVVEPARPYRVRIDYRNVEKLYVAVVKMSEEEARNLPGYRADERRRLEEELVRRRKVTSESFELPPDADFQTHSTELPLPSLSNGLYALLAGSDPAFSTSDNARAIVPFAASSLGVVERNLSDGRLEIRIVDGWTGQPVRGATVETYVLDYASGARFMEFAGDTRTDEHGVAYPPVGQRKPYALTVRHGDDKLVGVSSRYAYGRRQQEPATERVSHFFTDRAIYRPGQTIHFKAILLIKEGERHSVRADEASSVELLDPNGQEVASLDLTSNEYGTIKGRFTAPTGAGTGAMTIRDAHGGVQIRVEEYKRPRFEVTFDSLAGEVELLDSVRVTGRATAFSGAPVDGAAVRYRVVRRPIFRPLFHGHFIPLPREEAEIASGTAETGFDGSFSISFVARPDASIDLESNPRFRYEVTTDVTDLAGETQSGRTSLTAGYVSLVLGIRSEESIMVEDPGPIRFTAENLNGVPVEVDGTVTVTRLEPPERLLRPRLWDRVDRPIMSREEFLDLFPLDIFDQEDDPAAWSTAEKVLEEVFTTSTAAQIAPEVLASWAQGKYRVEITATDSKGRDVRAESIVTLYSVEADEPPFSTIDWLVPVKSKGEPGESARLLFGTSADEVLAFIEVERKSRIVESRSVTLSSRQRLLEFPIEPDDRGNFSVHLNYVRFGRLYTHTQLVTVPYTDRQLSVTLETFRDLLYPGTEEEWSVRITGSEGEPVVAELMASLYDASLDQFVPHEWHFEPYGSRSSTLSWRPSEWWGQDGGSLQGTWNPNPAYRPRRYETLNWFGLNGFLYRFRYDFRFARAPEADMVAQEAAVVEKGVVGLAQEARGGDAEKEPEPEPSPPSAPGPVRTDFNETAFFFPDLKTNADGQTILSFRIPEALTRWKLLGLAHTPDVRYGQVTATTETRKDLMITANAPRFLREGDTMEFAAVVQNLSDSSLTGEATLSLFDAATMSPVNSEFANLEPAPTFTLRAGESSGLEWSISIPEGIDMVVFRVTAEAGRHSDGEQKPLPVLTNRMLVTESLPMPMRAPGTRHFSFDRLRDARSPTLRHHAFSLEFTPNPVWYAVQALPYMMEFPYECTEQIFSRLYANSIAAHVVRENPRIQQVFERWQAIDAGALQSNLEKNPELKALVIEETPWLRAARDESERKRRIAVLFDFARMATEHDQAVRQLVESQYATGAWSWFSGMAPSRYVTQHIVAGFGHLRRLGIDEPSPESRLPDVLRAAVSWLDGQIKEDHDNLVATGADLKNRHINRLQVHYLYARSFFDEVQIAQESRQAYDYYVGQAAEYWLDNDLYTRGMIALALHRMGDRETPGNIIESLRELALHSDELGMYWKYDPGFFWYQAPIETQALLIEAFDEIGDDAESVSDMQLWLLKQKQTQDWKTTKATTEAVYALLMRGTRLLDEEGTAAIRVGDRVVSSDDPGASEPGTGYLYVSWEGEDVSPELASITVTKTGPGPAWGAAYWQYFEDLDRITAAETPLRMDKKLFVEVVTEIGPVLRPLEEKPSSEGDKLVVQVTIRVDRDMEYVHLKDMRGAGLEPINVLSGYRYQGGLGYYESTRDAATHFFIGYLPKGTYVFEYPLRANLSGDFSNGISSIQSMYAPEFAAHSEGTRIVVSD